MGNSTAVLIVDDTQDIRFLLKNILSDFKFDFFEAKNGIEALNVLGQEKKIELVLLDIMMPIMDGLKTMAEIAKLNVSLQRKIKVCFMSSLRDKTTILKALKLGGNDFIVKPIDPAILKTKVHELIPTTIVKDEFLWIKVNLNFKIRSSPLKVEQCIVSLSEFGASISGGSKYHEGAEFVAIGEDINNILKNENGIFCRVKISERSGVGHYTEIVFLGLNEVELQNLRCFTINFKG